MGLTDGHDAIEQSLEGTPYSLAPAGQVELARRIDELQQRVELLRSVGTLSATTLADYYGERRFEQVAESNAIEGSTLSVGETELAVLKGMTVTGHDPGFVRDAIALDRALMRLSELAKLAEPTDVMQVKEIHELILGDRSGAGEFRSVPVRISGSEHRPPGDWRGVMDDMEAWETWSRLRAGISPVLRSAVLHAWLAHIHPFTDGNGRTSRAITTLELIRAGFPPVIFRKKERARYLKSLAESDEGDLGSFLELVCERLDGALLGLERSAAKKQGYDREIAELRKLQTRSLAIWNTSVRLLFEMLLARLERRAAGVGFRITAELFMDSLDLEDYVELCSGNPISRSWCFRLDLSGPGIPTVSRLAWVGFRTHELRAALPSRDSFGPALFWSSPNPDKYPRWKREVEGAPGLVEATIREGDGNAWIVRDTAGRVYELGLAEVVDRIEKGMMSLLLGAPDGG